MGRVMRDGDIYHWHWKDAEKDRDSGPYRSYHCKSRIAVVTEHGRLIDTFWSSPTDNSYLNAEDVVLTYKGNKHEMTVLTDNPEFYRPDDLVNMRHSNNSGAPIYLQRGAKRDRSTMIEWAQQRHESARRKHASAASEMARFEEYLSAIQSGKTDGHFY